MRKSEQRQTLPKPDQAPLHRANTSGIPGQKLVSPRNPFWGLTLWLVSMIVLYTSWNMIFLVARNAGGTYPSVLQACLNLMYVISVIWSIVAAGIFRAESRKFIEMDKQYSGRKAYSRPITNIVALGIICCPFVMIIVFLYVTSH